MDDVADPLARLDADERITTVRERIRADRRSLTDPQIKLWCGQRWRNLFLSEAERDERAVKVASRLLDNRPKRQRLAERFLAADIEDWRLELPDPTPATIDTALLFIPGFLHRGVPVPGLPDLEVVGERFGAAVVRADTHPVRGSEANIPDVLRALDAAEGADVAIIGYSKGTTDALTLLAKQPETAERVRALVCWAGAVGGTPVADNILDLIKDISVDSIVGNELVLTILKALLPIVRLDGLIERPDEWDLRRAVTDMTIAERAQFTAEYGSAIDALDVPIFNLVARAGPLEVPYFQMQGSLDISKRYGSNDMQVSCVHQQVTSPMATTLAVCHAHHWDIAMGPFPITHRLGSPNLDNPFPSGAAAAATVLLLTELGLLT